MELPKTETFSIIAGRQLVEGVGDTLGVRRQQKLVLGVKIRLPDLPFWPFVPNLPSFVSIGVAAWSD
jgi:hypothetical protein